MITGNRNGTFAAEHDAVRYQSAVIQGKHESGLLLSKTYFGFVPRYEKNIDRGGQWLHTMKK